MAGKHNHEKGQTTVYLGGAPRLVWFKNQTRRKLEEIMGEGVHWVSDPEEVKRRMGFDLVGKLLEAGCSYTEWEAQPGDLADPPDQDTIDVWMDDLITIGDLDDPDVIKLLNAGKGETFETLATKVSRAYNWSISGIRPPSETPDDDDEPQGNDGATT